MKLDKKIGIIGYGNMGSAIAGRLKAQHQIFVFDKDTSKIKNVVGIEVIDTLVKLCQEADIIILAIKPQDFEGVLAEIKNYSTNKLVISIAAGISTGYIEKQLAGTRIVRVMPNLAIKVSQGMICLCKGKFARQEDLAFSKELFNNLGETLILKEDLMDAATAISGSGPGFLYDLISDKNKRDWEDYVGDSFIPLLSASAQGLGFSSLQAQVLAKATAQGSMVLLKETGLAPKELCAQVASKGGTTEAGLEVLHKGGSLQEAAKAALKRAKELAKKE